MLASEVSKTNAATETHSSNGVSGGKKRRKRNGKICICVTLLIIFLFFIILHVLALTLFKPKRPITTIDALNLKVILNLTLQVNLSLKNPHQVFQLRFFVGIA
ncbi:hypothetical protein Bca101_037977 [Brassica carinata]